MNCQYFRCFSIEYANSVCILRCSLHVHQSVYAVQRWDLYLQDVLSVFFKIIFLQPPSLWEELSEKGVSLGNISLYRPTPQSRFVYS